MGSGAGGLAEKGRGQRLFPAEAFPRGRLTLSSSGEGKRGPWGRQGRGAIGQERDTEAEEPSTWRGGGGCGKTQSQDGRFLKARVSGKLRFQGAPRASRNKPPDQHPGYAPCHVSPAPSPPTWALSRPPGVCPLRPSPGSSSVLGGPAAGTVRGKSQGLNKCRPKAAV